VIKRNGSEEPVHFDKITSRIKKLAYGLNADFCDPVRPPALALPRGYRAAQYTPSTPRHDVSPVALDAIRYRARGSAPHANPWLHPPRRRSGAGLQRDVCVCHTRGHARWVCGHVAARGTHRALARVSWWARSVSVGIRRYGGNAQLYAGCTRIASGSSKALPPAASPGTLAPFSVRTPCAAFFSAWSTHRRTRSVACACTADCGSDARRGERPGIVDFKRGRRTTRVPSYPSIQAVMLSSSLCPSHFGPAPKRASTMGRNDVSLKQTPCVCPMQVLVAQKVTTGVYKGVTTSELDELAAETAASLTSQHPDYALVSGTHALWVDCQRARSVTHSVHMTLMAPLPPLPSPQLAARIAVSNLHKSTKKSFSQTCVPPPLPHCILRVDHERG
jgi:hypothetical protein